MVEERIATVNNLQDELRKSETIISSLKQKLTDSFSSNDMRKILILLNSLQNSLNKELET